MSEPVKFEQQNKINPGISREELSRSFHSFSQKVAQIHLDIFNEKPPKDSSLGWKNVHKEAHHGIFSGLHHDKD